MTIMKIFLDGKKNLVCGITIRKIHYFYRGQFVQIKPNIQSNISNQIYPSSLQTICKNRRNKIFALPSFTYYLTRSFQLSPTPSYDPNISILIKLKGNFIRHKYVSKKIISRYKSLMSYFNRQNNLFSLSF